MMKNPKQVRLANDSRTSPGIKGEPLSTDATVEVDLPGIQGVVTWELKDWASYLYTALRHHTNNIRLHAFPRVECPIRLIALSEALELAQYHGKQNDDARELGNMLGINSPCLARCSGYPVREAFVHCCFAIYNVREVIIEHLFEKMGDPMGDVLLAEALAIAEKAITDEGCITELATIGESQSHLLFLATRARAHYIRQTFTLPLAAAYNRAGSDLQRDGIAMEQGRGATA